MKTEQINEIMQQLGMDSYSLLQGINDLNRNPITLDDNQKMDINSLIDDLSTYITTLQDF